MNILICISHVPDTTTKVKFTADGSSLDSNGVTFVINPYDEFCLARAMELKEQGIVPSEPKILCVGGPEVEATIRKALGVGGTGGVRIDAPAQDAYSVAVQIAEYVKKNPQDIIMMGKESIDNNGSEVPAMVAELLDLPFVSFATHLDIKDGKAIVSREIDGGEEVIEVAPPFVLSAQKGLAEWRIPNMRGIMQARSKPLEVVAGTAAEAATKVEQYALPPAKGGMVTIAPDKMEELVKVLVEKGAL
jgi:electron transfer flavoprotein beta subunit